MLYSNLKALPQPSNTNPAIREKMSRNYRDYNFNSVDHFYLSITFQRKPMQHVQLVPKPRLLISEDVVKHAATLRRIRWPRIGANFELAVLFLC